MREKQNLTKEISKNANLLPLECKERVLELMKAMVFTKEVITKNNNIPQSRKIG